MTDLTRPLGSGQPSFLDAPRCPRLDALAADLAVLGLPCTTPVDLAASRAPCAGGPAGLRAASLRYAASLDHYDFDFGGPLLAGRGLAFADLGDVAMTPGRYAENAERAADAVRAVLGGGAFPIVLGGDRAALIPFARAFAAQGPLGLVHFGAELDWADQVDGVRDGAPSSLRRAAELPWLSSVVQLGLRGLSPVGEADVEQARASGCRLVRAETLHDEGVAPTLERLPRWPRLLVSIDLAVMDPAIAPGVEQPAFGGLTYFQVTRLLSGLAARSRVAGLLVSGLAAERDSHGLTALLGARLALNLVGALAHAGQLGAAALASLPATAARAATLPARSLEVVR